MAAQRSKHVPRHLRPALAPALTLALCLPLAAPAAADDWPQFRGRHRDGVSRESGLADAWPAAGPREAWRRPLGAGYSAVSVVGDRLYTLYAMDGDEPVEVAAAFDAATGEELWRTPIGERIETEFGNGPRSTPAVDGDAVYALGSHGSLVALAAADGAVRWRTMLPEVFEAQRPHWGYATSPMVEGGLLLLEGGAPEGRFLVAFDKASGEIRWTTGSDPRAAGHYNSPVAVTVGEERQLVYLASGELRAVTPAGEEVWRHPWGARESHAVPLFLPPDRFFASGVGDDEGGAVLRVGDDGVEEVWKSRSMKNHFSSSVYHDGHIYGFDNATFKCISADTGETRWAKRGLGKGSLIYADGHLLVLSDRGKLLLVAASPEGYLEKGSIQALGGKTWTAPSLAGGRLYLRGHEEMVCYDLEAPKRED